MSPIYLRLFVFYTLTAYVFRKTQVQAIKQELPKWARTFSEQLPFPWQGKEDILPVGKIHMIAYKLQEGKLKF